ncbi:MAG TPA: HlyD family efflux transporter periplasmic adaptor subunit [Gemmatales bacterium]|nr:HlyD family efflux transporter periplasmic adaptor subunit [Gemmatales bacterium]HMP58653.1 HlyD family efflux transporter periplasmic adaptor subunit [Gemmatales bacterium]
MSNPGELSELERRKQVRIRLRPDLDFILQKYEGKSFHVVKDPVSMRYYRFKEHEQFLLGFLDGTHTLEDAQKAFEARFRPERLTLEDLESFTSQLLQAGLAQNETPGAGKQLFERYKKRSRRMFMQKFMNLLYIKIPLFDPDRLLRLMLPHTRFIFTRWFLALSVAFLLAALLLVLRNWNVFLSKLPAYHEFFTMKTVVYLWVALGLVKVIHEFGHGLSCKAFGGEVHEMGLLFLVFSPCMYCNVSDAWMMPNKWHRIIISSAGIYVELIIAAAATFVWWNSEPGGFVSTMSMALMVVCSVSTFVFNANPLMRFDGYYILSDWIEIPNLREKANRYLLQLAQEHALGIEVPPQPYMSLGRKVLFVIFAIVSWFYRWFITFAVLVFMYTFLQPYKLGVISFILGTASVATMFGQPLYQLFKHVQRRGRLPDMKPLRTTISAALLAGSVAALLFIPLPMRVSGVVLITVDPANLQRVVVPEYGGILKERLVVDGQSVQTGDELVRLHNPRLEIDLRINEVAQAQRKVQVTALMAQYLAGGRETRLIEELNTAQAELRMLQTMHRDLKRQLEGLVIRAPRDGLVMSLVPVSEIGKALERGQPICEIGDDRDLRAVLLVTPSDRALFSEGAEAWVRVHGLAYNWWPGRVMTISETEAKEVPTQLSFKAGGDVATQHDEQTKMERPQSQHYIIAIKLKPPIYEGIHTGAMGKARIVAPPRTVWWRINRYLATTFNWGL